MKEQKKRGKKGTAALGTPEVFQVSSTDLTTTTNSELKIFSNFKINTNPNQFNTKVVKLSILALL